MSLTLATEYAIRALVRLAKNYQKQIKIADIARSEGISFTYLNKVFQKLAKNKIVTTKTGVRGGIKLTRKPEMISLREIIEAIQGQNILRSIKVKSTAGKGVKNNKLQELLSEAEKQVLIYFKRATLKDLIKA